MHMPIWLIITVCLVCIVVGYILGVVNTRAECRS